MKKSLKQNRFLIIFGLNFLLLLLTIHCISFNLTYSTGAIYNYSDLQEGEIILFDSQITVEDYLIQENIYSGAYDSASSISNINIHYCDDEDCLSDWNFGLSKQITADAPHKVLSYKDVYNLDNGEYVGWEVRFAKRYSGDLCIYDEYSYECIENHQGDVVLVPTKNKEVVCLSDNENVISKWYKYSEDMKVTIDKNIDGNFVKEGNKYSFLRNGTYSEPAVLSFDFNSNKNDSFYFKILGNYGYGLSYEIDNVDYSFDQEIPFYARKKINLANEGNNNLTFNLGNFYNGALNVKGIFTIIKEPMILTYLNSGEKLDPTMVSDGDNIINIKQCSTGYIRETKSVYEEKDNQDDNVLEENKNPETGDRLIINIIFILFISIIALILLRMFLYSNKKL